MGICGTSSVKNHPSDQKLDKSQESNGPQKQSQTVKLFDYNQNKIVQVPVLVPAKQSNLFSKRHAQSPNMNQENGQQITQL